MLWTSETVATRALDGDDNRLVLLALDRTRSALETLMKAHGMLGPDVSVTIDNRQINQFAGWSTEAVRALTEFGAVLESGGSVSDACSAVQGQDNTPQLPPGREDEKGVVA
jgi:hypothetical protein